MIFTNLRPCRCVLIREVSSLEKCPHFRGVLFSIVINFGPYRRVLIREVSSFQLSSTWDLADVSSLERRPH